MSNPKIVNKFRWKEFNPYEEFLITFLLTYILTVTVTVLLVFSNFETDIAETNLGIFDFLKSTIKTYDFNQYKELTPWLYLTARIVETIMPTTLTFCASILAVYSVKSYSTGTSFCLFVSLLVYTIVGSFFLSAKSLVYLKTFIWLLNILFMISVLLSATVYSRTKQDWHKNEKSDGQISG